MYRPEIEDIRLVAESPIGWERLNNKTLLISGGTGFVGTFLINVIKYRNKIYNAGIKVVSLSRRGGISSESVEFLQADINNEIKCPENIDYILHLASNTHPKQYAEDPVGTITTNIIGCNNLLKIAVEKKVKRFLLASSVEIYGQGSNNPMNEEYCGYINCNQARSGYNEAKRTCEALCQSYIVQNEIDCVIVRFARIIGADKKQDTKAISQFMERAVNGDDIVLKSNGNQRYSFIYIADAVSGLLKVLLDGFCGEAYNVSADDEGKTLGEYAHIIASFAGKGVEFNLEQDSSVSKATFALLDNNKLKRIGWIPRYSITDGLKRTYDILKLSKEEKD